MNCTCRSVDDGEGGTTVRWCPIHESGPELLRAIESLVSALAHRDDDARLTHHGRTPDQIYQESLSEAKKLIRKLAPEYDERPRGIRGIPDAGVPDRPVAGFISGSTETTRIGFVNRNHQRCGGHRGTLGTDHGQFAYRMECLKCGCVYGANGADVFERKCPDCQGGLPGIAF